MEGDIIVKSSDFVNVNISASFPCACIEKRFPRGITVGQLKVTHVNNHLHFCLLRFLNCLTFDLFTIIKVKIDPLVQLSLLY